MNNKEKEIPYLELIPGIDVPKMEKNDISEKNELNQEEKNEINILKKKFYILIIIIKVLDVIVVFHLYQQISFLDSI